MTTASQLGPGSNPLPALSESNTASTPHSSAPGLRSDAGNGSGKQSLQLVYVFTTHLANTYAPGPGLGWLPFACSHFSRLGARL